MGGRVTGFAKTTVFFHFRFWEEEKFNGDLSPGGDLFTPPKRDYNENPVLITLLYIKFL